MLTCPTCRHESSSLCLTETHAKKQGLASMLSVKCSYCKYSNDFCTSVQNSEGNKAFDINKRAVYTMRALGHGHAGLEKFTAMMDMPKPMASTTYDKLVKTIASAVKTVAENTMSEAAEEIRQKETTTVDTGVSCDGSWQRRGYSSLNGVFTAISLVNGKVLDVESMSRSCKGCVLKKELLKTDPTAYAQWRNSHVCKFNYKGSAGGMEVEEAKRVINRSVEKYNLRYVEFLGDGDSKSFISVKDTYPEVTVKKLECVGHYQKRVGTRLRNLKNKRERFRSWSFNRCNY